ncbi:transposase [Ferrigenium sp. UT4]
MSYNELRKGRVSQVGRVYHVTLVTRNRAPIFAELANGRELVRQMMKLQDESVAETLCFVIMPDHLHWLMALREGTLPTTIKMLKGRTAHTFGRPIWQTNYHDHAIRQDEDLRKAARYIVANPLRAGLVERIGDYPLWDAAWLDQTLSG